MTETNTTGQVDPKSKPQSKYDYANGPDPLDINYQWCKACDICIALCPKEVLEPNRDGKPIQVRPENCTQCTICWVHCPDFAIISNYK